MNVLVTGSSGKLGRFVVADLLAHGHTVVPVDLRSSKDPLALATKIIDITRYDDFLPLLDGVEAICHLGNIPYIEERFAQHFSNNVAGTYVVLESAFEAGVRNIVYASSIQAYGLFRSRYPGKIYSRPQYLPVDEDHPRLTQDTYPMSKAVGEFIAESFVRREPTFQIFSLRFTGIMIPGMYEKLNRLQSRRPSAERLADALGTYIYVQDAARAVRLAIESRRPGYTALNIVSPRSIHDWTEQELIAAHGVVPEFREKLGPSDSLITWKRAQEVLGFVAEFTASGERMADFQNK